MLFVAWGMGDEGDGCKPLMVAEQVCLCDCQLKVQNVEIFAFNAAHVTLAEDAGAKCPVDVL